MNIIKYISGSFLILLGLGFMFNNSFLGGLLITFVGIALLPPVSKKNKEKYPFWRKDILRRSMLSFLAIVGFLFAMGKTAGNSTSNKSEIASSEDKDTQSKNNKRTYNADGNLKQNKTKKGISSKDKIDTSKIKWVSNFNPSKIRGDWYQIIWFNPSSADDKTYIGNDDEEQLKLSLTKKTYQTSSIASGNNPKFNYHIKNNRIIVTTKSRIASEIFNHKIKISKDNSLMMFVGEYEVNVYQKK